MFMALEHTAGVLTTAAAVGDGEVVVCHLHEPPHAVPNSIAIHRLTEPAVEVEGVEVMVTVETWP